MSDWRDIPIEDLGLGTRAYNCLKYGSEIRTAGQLAMTGDGELLKITNLGRRTLAELRAATPSNPPLEPKFQLSHAMLDWVLGHQELVTILMHGTTIASVQIIIPVER